MDATVNINGVLSQGEHAVVSVFDHGFLFGDGVYETLRTYDRHPFLFEPHLDRLRASAHRLSIVVPVTDQELAERVQDTMWTVNPDGAMTALHVAAIKGQIDLLRILLAHGAGHREQERGGAAPRRGGGREVH